MQRPPNDSAMQDPDTVQATEEPFVPVHRRRDRRRAAIMPIARAEPTLSPPRPLFGWNERLVAMQSYVPFTSTPITRPGDWPPLPMTFSQPSVLAREGNAPEPTFNLQKPGANASERVASLCSGSFHFPTQTSADDEMEWETCMSEEYQNAEQRNSKRAAMSMPNLGTQSKKARMQVTYTAPAAATWNLPIQCEQSHSPDLFDASPDEMGIASPDLFDYSPAASEMLAASPDVAATPDEALQQVGAGAVEDTTDDADEAVKAHLQRLYDAGEAPPLELMLERGRMRASTTKTLKTSTREFEVFFRPEALLWPGGTNEVLDHVIGSLFEEGRGRYGPQDYIGMDFHFAGMPTSRYIRHRRIAAFAPQLFRRELFDLAQSGTNTKVELTARGRLTLIFVKGRTGSGKRRRNVIPYDGGQERSSKIMTIVKGEDYCLPKALVLAKAYAEPLVTGDRRRFRALRYPTVLKESALALMRDAGIPRSKSRDYGKEELQVFQDHLSAYQINVFLGDTTMRPWFNGPYVSQRAVLNLRLHEGHFDHIKKMAPFFSREYWCARCNMTYDHLERHYVCPVRCVRCWHFDQSDCEEEGVSIQCPDCRMRFRSQACLLRHTQSPTDSPQETKTACQTNKVCATCSAAVYKRTNAADHKCGEEYCTRCAVRRPTDHKQCYLRKCAPLSKRFIRKTIFFDIESNVRAGQSAVPAPSASDGGDSDTEDDSRYEKSRHEANVLLALKCCTKCQDMMPSSYTDTAFGRCEDCGDPSDRLKVWHSLDRENEGVNPIRLFLEWLGSRCNKGYTAIAHNLKG